MSICVLHIVEAYSRREGGVPQSVAQIVTASERRGIRGKVCATLPCNEIDALSADRSLALANGWLQRKLWVPHLARLLREEFRRESAGLVHIHGVWSAPQRMAATVAAELRVPAVLSPHNMLNPGFMRWDGAVKMLLKKVYWSSIGAAAFNRVAAIHAVTEEEAKTVADFFAHISPTVIPNSINLEVLPSGCAQESAAPARIVLALGRMVRVKAFDRLIHAFAAVARGTDWQLHIVGPADDRKYTHELELLAAELGIGGQFLLRDAIYAPEKYRLLRDAWIVAVPSEAEVIGMVNLEAAACATPTIASETCGLQGWTQNGGLLCPPSIDGVRDALRKALQWTLAERMDRGTKLRAWIARQYSTDAVADAWAKFYGSVNSRGPSPST